MIGPLPPKTAVLGACGLVGRRLFAAYRRFHPDSVGTDWKGRDGLARLDLEAPDPTPLRLPESGHAWAVIAAVGARDFGVCERQPEYTRRRNVDGTLELTRRLADLGVKVVFISSDVIFDGKTGGYRDDAPANPVNEYGRQKAEVEKELPVATRGRFLALRVGRVVGAEKGDGTLPDETAQRLTSGQGVDAAYDQVFTPTLLEDFPRVLAALQAVDAAGIVNAAGPEAWSRLDIALRLAEGLGADKGLVRQIALDEVGGDVPRPKNISLKCERLRTLGLELTPFSRCLEKVVANYKRA